MGKKFNKESALEMIEFINSCVDDPLRFVQGAFNWGEGDLAGFDGPDDWQVRVLKDIAKATTLNQSLRYAVASGHGIGKTALIAWIILWFMSTRPNPQIVVTANTGKQLDTKTWRELAKWWKRAINKDLFIWTKTKFYMKDEPEDWYATAIPWNEENSESFAGTHDAHVLTIYDEASAISDKIWEVSEGTMTTKGAMWIAFGNPTKNTGRFKECFTRFKHRWQTMQVDSRTAKMTDKDEINQWVEDWGEDSDFVRVRVRGVFPRASSAQFISSDIVDAARGRIMHQMDYSYAPVIIGVDVARYGDDQTVLIVRQGPVILHLEKRREMSTVEVARMTMRFQDEYSAAAVFVDGIGIGAGVIDYMKSVGRDPIDVVSNAKAAAPNYANLRAEMWSEMRDWLKNGCIPDDEELYNDLIAPEYFYDNANRIILEKKDDLKKRLGNSPDCADALAMTFAAPVEMQATWGNMAQEHKTAVMDYDLFGGLQ